MKISNQISTNLASLMSEQNIISNSQKELYAYCFDFVLDILFFNISVLLIGLILREPFLSALYIITMTPTKMMAGGAHANSQETCSAISYTIAISSILLAANVSLLSVSTQTELFIFFSCIISIAALTPVDTPNKRLDITKQKHLKKNCLIYLLILSVIYLLFYNWEYTKYYSIMTICVMIIAVNQYIGVYISMHDKQNGGENHEIKHCNLR